MRTLESYVCGEWRKGESGVRPLHDPTTGATVAEAGTGGIDMKAVLDHGRNAGGPRLREMTYAQRAEMLGTVAKAVHAKREELIELAVLNGGNTRKDAKFDLDGATGTLMAYAQWGAELGETRVLFDGEGQQLGRTARFWGEHVWLPREGVAVHINAFNFPAWGLAEKAACAWLAGMPVITKPATATSLVTEEIVRIMIDSGALPEGALQLICGSAGDLLDHMESQDVLAFTGSADTAFLLRSNENLLRRSVRVNVEADSLNSAVLGPDVQPGTETWDLFLRDVMTEMTQKAGQKCTAVRRIFVPESTAEAVQTELVDRLSAIKVGNPALREVTVSPLATASQKRDMLAGIEKLSAECDIVFGSTETPDVVDADAEAGYFCGPVLLRAKDAASSAVVHEHEVFGPVATLIVTDGDAAGTSELVRRGDGSLVASVYSDDKDYVRDMVLGIGAWHGRLYLGSGKMADQSLGSGTVLPASVHGGPGRAGGGEELGLERGMRLYQQRVALQGDRGMLKRLFS
jgi:oxepin-CoA hydrolase/3-oxo-5,6-dehydrosuberyl-CoA semialdehyde dehydrogenase